MKTILVTGANGFVGRALLARFATMPDVRVVALVRDWTHEPPDAVLVRGDVTDADVCRRMLADYEVDSIYHLAAQAIVSTCAEDPVTALDVAVMGTARLLQAVRDTGRSAIRTVVSTSDKVYGSAPPPYDENTALLAKHAYEVSKACQDLTARMFFHNFGLDVRVVRAVNIYGPGDPNSSRVIPRTVARALSRLPPLLHEGASTMRRQYVYIDDMIDALLTVHDSGEAGEAYCVGSANAPISVMGVMTTIAVECEIPWSTPQVKPRGDRFMEIADQAVNDQKLRRLGWLPKVPFHEGIRRTIAAAKAAR